MLTNYLLKSHIVVSELAQNFLNIYNKMIQFVWKQYDKIKKHNSFMKRIIFLFTRIFFTSKN